MQQSCNWSLVGALLFLCVCVNKTKMKWKSFYSDINYNAVFSSGRFGGLAFNVGVSQRRGIWTHFLTLILPLCGTPLAWSLTKWFRYLRYEYWVLPKYMIQPVLTRRMTVVVIFMANVFKWLLLSFLLASCRYGSFSGLQGHLSIIKIIKTFWLLTSTSQPLLYLPIKCVNSVFNEHELPVLTASWEAEVLIPPSLFTFFFLSPSASPHGQQSSAVWIRGSFLTG